MRSWVKSPKSDALPVVAIVTKSILLRLLVLDGLYPPANIPLILFDVAPGVVDLLIVKSPKSVPFPVLAMVKNSIVFTNVVSFGARPPP